MAITPTTKLALSKQDLADPAWHTALNAGVLDRLDSILTRSGASSPLGAVVPDYVSQRYLDTTTKFDWIATGLTNADWIRVGNTFIGTEAGIAALTSARDGDLAWTTDRKRALLRNAGAWVGVKQYTGARVTRTSIQSMATSPTGVLTAIQWQSATIDTNVFFSGGAPTRLTIPSGLGISKVRLFASIGFTFGAGASNTYVLQMKKNGAFVEGVVQPAAFLPNAGPSTWYLSLASAILSVSAADYFEFFFLGVNSNSASVGIRDGAVPDQAPHVWAEIEVVE